ncbi:hypothetical protein DFA_02884 [Cavenderia fasciculata]|uniref:Uncharacterized protein n=1 Tax=Cavenderia fasciculata TaxID=261658 RepID=F4PIR1_CACFS|nr:uncharacterized protein DFA_02884 [Cavenderia fasciculata]EGG24640.1 hypothetical protein DFA_02884 [Cavenderia fasciculata]|eukprot:XP_004362491.1 hypothetical protein DFA_02884 [Cavenderia fasciculata]
MTKSEQAIEIIKESNLTAREKVACVNFIGRDQFTIENSAQVVLNQNAAGVLREFAQDLDNFLLQERLCQMGKTFEEIHKSYANPNRSGNDYFITLYQTSKAKQTVVITFGCKIILSVCDRSTTTTTHITIIV